MSTGEEARLTRFNCCEVDGLQDLVGSANDTWRQVDGLASGTKTDGYLRYRVRPGRICPLHTGGPCDIEGLQAICVKSISPKCIPDRPRFACGAQNAGQREWEYKFGHGNCGRISVADGGLSEEYVWSTVADRPVAAMVRMQLVLVVVHNLQPCSAVGNSHCRHLKA